jgi:hypothetical protein
MITARAVAQADNARQPAPTHRPNQHQHQPDPATCPALSSA